MRTKGGRYGEVDPRDLYGLIRTPAPTTTGDLTVTYDKDANAAYIYLPAHPRTSGCVAHTRPLPDAPICIDYDSEGTAIGVEIYAVHSKTHTHPRT